LQASEGGRGLASQLKKGKKKKAMRVRFCSVMKEDNTSEPVKTRERVPKTRLGIKNGSRERGRQVSHKKKRGGKKRKENSCRSPGRSFYEKGPIPQKKQPAKSQPEKGELADSSKKRGKKSCAAQVPSRRRGPRTKHKRPRKDDAGGGRKGSGLQKERLTKKGAKTEMRPWTKKKKHLKGRAKVRCEGLPTTTKNRKEKNQNRLR